MKEETPCNEGGIRTCYFRNKIIIPSRPSEVCGGMHPKPFTHPHFAPFKFGYYQRSCGHMQYIAEQLFLWSRYCCHVCYFEIWGENEWAYCTAYWIIANPNKIQSTMESHEIYADTTGTRRLLPSPPTSTEVLKLYIKRKMTNTRNRGVILPEWQKRLVVKLCPAFYNMESLCLTAERGTYQYHRYAYHFHYYYENRY
jgi:hypothetical protein